MEALEHLQAVHGHLRLLHTHAIATSHSPTNSFLADFLLILGEYGKSSAKMEILCAVLVDAVPKMMASTLFDEMAHVHTSVSDSKPQHNSPRTQIAAEDKLKMELMTSQKGLSNRKDHRGLTMSSWMVLQCWRLEQSLCTALTAREEVKFQDVLRATRFKSFDYRVLNLLLYDLRNEPVDEAHFEFLSISELLVEITDDSFDYEEDVGKNTFNVLRMFLYTYGPREAPTRLAEIIGESKVKNQKLLEEQEHSSEISKRCEEAVKEGGSKSRIMDNLHLITDEDTFRKQIM